MELAKVTSKGQITIPIAIRNALGIREGDKILFMEEGDKVILTNASTNLFDIRDLNDYPVLYAAIIENIDVFITVDKDFLDVEIEMPEIMMPGEFIERVIKKQLNFKIFIILFQPCCTMLQYFRKV